MELAEAAQKRRAETPNPPPVTLDDFAVTALGRFLAILPVDPSHGRVLALAVALGGALLPQAVVAVAAVSAQVPMMTTG